MLKGLLIVLWMGMSLLFCVKGGLKAMQAVNALNQKRMNPVWIAFWITFTVLFGGSKPSQAPPSGSSSWPIPSPFQGQLRFVPE